MKFYWFFFWIMKLIKRRKNMFCSFLKKKSKFSYRRKHYFSTWCITFISDSQRIQYQLCLFLFINSSCTVGTADVRFVSYRRVANIKKLYKKRLMKNSAYIYWNRLKNIERMDQTSSSRKRKSAHRVHFHRNIGLTWLPSDARTLLETPQNNQLENIAQ